MGNPRYTSIIPILMLHCLCILVICASFVFTVYRIPIIVKVKITIVLYVGAVISQASKSECHPISLCHSLLHGV